MTTWLPAYNKATVPRFPGDWCNDIQIDRADEKQTHILSGQLPCDRGSKKIQWTKDSLWNKWCQDRRTSACPEGQTEGHKSAPTRGRTWKSSGSGSWSWCGTRSRTSGWRQVKSPWAWMRNTSLESTKEKTIWNRRQIGLQKKFKFLWKMLFRKRREATDGDNVFVKNTSDRGLGARIHTWKLFNNTDTSNTI